MLKRVLIQCVLVMCISVMGLAAGAQEESLSQDTGDIYFYTHTILFPEAVGFNLVVALPSSDIARLTLTLFLPEQAPLVIEVNARQHAIYDQEFTELVYIWENPPDSPVGMLAQVNYQWVVISIRDRVSQAADTFLFGDTRAEWLRDAADDGHLNFTAPEGVLDVNVLRNSVRDVYALLAKNTGSSPNFNILLYPPALSLEFCVANADGQAVLVEPVSKREVRCDDNMAQTVFAAAGYNVLQLPSPLLGIDDRAVLVEFLIERFYAGAWQGKNVPAWFKTGLAQFYLPTLKPELLTLVRPAARNNRLFTLEQMAAGPDITRPDVFALWRAQSYGMVVYIASEIGVPGLFELAGDVENAASFADAYQRATGKPLAALLPAWQNWIFRDAAVAAYAYHPYLAETPVPAPTRTPSPFPPTATSTYTPSYTPSATATYTPTPTVTGVLSATPLPTNTPRPTNVPPTPSITPRPPGSLIDTPTPIPAAPAAGQVNANSGLYVGIVVFIFALLAVLIVVYMRVTRSR